MNPSRSIGEAYRRARAEYAREAIPTSPEEAREIAEMAARSGRSYQLSTCPVPVVDDIDEDGHPSDYRPCGAEVSIEINVHDDGAEYGVWADGTTTCGHTLGTIAHVEQYTLLGVDLY